MSPDHAGSSDRDRRRARLASSLRENLKRRKAQQRSRAVETPAPSDATPSEAPPADDGKR